MVAFRIGVFLAALPLMAGGVRTTRTQSRSGALELLDRYDRGEHDAVLRAVLAMADPEALAKDLERSGPKWIASRGAGAEGRRRLIAATLALEVAHARLEDEWTVLRSLVEWGCQLLRAGPPSDEERLWQLASVALSEGALDDHMLFKPSGNGPKTYGHLAHAGSRFPGELRFGFAQRFAVPVPSGGSSQLILQAGIERALDTSPVKDSQRLEMTTGWGAPGAPKRIEQSHAAADRARMRDVAIRDLKTLTESPVVGGEAALRIGHLLILNDRLEEALSVFSSAVGLSSDPYVTYLGYFLSGRVLERLDRTEQAEQAYGKALEAIPHAQSAVLSRSALLVRAGRTPEATALTAASFAARPRPPDPWRLYPYGDYRRWPDLIAQLRAVLR